jgi:hypothetical protein
MRHISDKPLFTEVLPDASEFRPSSGSCYILGATDEERSQHWSEWEANRSDVRLFSFKDLDRATTEVTADGSTTPLLLRSTNQLTALFEDAGASEFYIDITGLPHHIWAPLVRAARLTNVPTKVVYVEPGDYRYSRSPTEADIFDLSEETSGIAPLPGFASLLAEDSEALFVPLLGFEGARFAHLLEHVQPDREDIYPVIGVPGFRIMYPFFTYQGNRNALLDTRAWHNVRYARANCPFSLYYTLGEISQVLPGRHLKIAPIGTKPHALGAVLYHLDNPSTSELIYDHPVRKSKRTEGTSRICVYDLTPMGPITRPLGSSAVRKRGRDEPLSGS